MDQVIPSFEVSCWTVVAERGEYGHYTMVTKEELMKKSIKIGGGIGETSPFIETLSR